MDVRLNENEMTRTKEKEYTKHSSFKIKVTHAHGGLFIPDFKHSQAFSVLLYAEQNHLSNPMHVPSSPTSFSSLGSEYYLSISTTTTIRQMDETIQSQNPTRL
jgi:hypothetical protein